MKWRRKQAQIILDHMLAGHEVDRDVARRIASSERLAARIREIRMGEKISQYTVSDRWVERTVTVDGEQVTARTKTYFIKPEDRGHPRLFD